MLLTSVSGTQKCCSIFSKSYLNFNQNDRIRASECHITNCSKYCPYFFCCCYIHSNFYSCKCCSMPMPCFRRKKRHHFNTPVIEGQKRKLHCWPKPFVARRSWHRIYTPIALFMNLMLLVPQGIRSKLSLTLD